MSTYLDQLVYKEQLIQCYREYINTLRKTYNLPECLPPLGLLPTRLKALESLSEQHPNDVLILHNLIAVLKEQKD